MALKFIQTKKMTLAGGGCTSTATSIIINDMTLPDGVTSITTSDLGSTCYATLEQATSKEEQVSFTGITDNGNGTYTITGVTRGLRFVSPYDEVTANKFAHAGGAIFVITNTAAFYNTIKAYIDGIAIAGASNATTTLQGLVELPTTAEVNAGTATGETGAALAVTPDALLASNYGLNIPTADQKLFLGGIIGMISPYAGRSAPTGFLMCDGSAVSRATYAALLAVIAPSQTCTGATNDEITAASHGLVAGDQVHFTTTGTLPAGLSTNTDYYVIASGLTATVFKVALSPAGTVIDITDTGSGVHTVYKSAFGKGDGSTTFNVPDLRSKSPVGLSASAPTQTFKFQGAQRSGNTITILDTVFPSQGQAVILTTTGALPTGLSLATTYYIIRVSSTSISFATSLANANAGTAITLSGNGSGVNTMTFTNLAHTVLGRQGGEETHGVSDAEMPSHIHVSNGGDTGGVGSHTMVVDGNDEITDQFNDIMQSAGSDAVHNNMSPFTVVNYIIKY